MAIFYRATIWSDWICEMIRLTCPPSDAETRIFQQANNIATDALAPCVTRSPAAILLNIWDKQVLISQEGRFQLPVFVWCWEIVKNIYIYFHIFSNTFGMIIINML